MNLHAASEESVAFEVSQMMMLFMLTSIPVSILFTHEGVKSFAITNRHGLRNFFWRFRVRNARHVGAAKELAEMKCSKRATDLALPRKLSRSQSHNLGSKPVNTPSPRRHSHHGFLPCARPPDEVNKRLEMDGTELTDLEDVVIDFGPNDSPDKAPQKG